MFVHIPTLMGIRVFVVYRTYLLEPLPGKTFQLLKCF